MLFSLPLNLRIISPSVRSSPHLRLLRRPFLLDTQQTFHSGAQPKLSLKCRLDRGFRSGIEASARLICALG